MKLGISERRSSFFGVTPNGFEAEEPFTNESDSAKSAKLFPFVEVILKTA